MGEAKNRARRLASLQAAQPFCVFCGGSTLGDTIDHVPPIAIFDLRRRPKGLEFLACASCNLGSRRADQIVGYLSRIYPDPQSLQTRSEVRRILRSIKSNCPGLLEEMLPSASQEKLFREHSNELSEAGGVLNVAGPMVNRAVRMLGGKLGLAMHFNQTERIVPTTGCVAVRWYSNYDALTGTIPGDFLAMLGPPKTLRQGRFEVSNQFTVSSAMSAESRLSVHFATFRKSLAIAAFVAEDEADLVYAPNTHKVRPGWLNSAG